MADRDENYRGYGNPSDRYYENREYDRGQGGDRAREPRNERGGLFGSDRDHRGRDDDRGFLERAGEQVRSWFSDDDDDRGRERFNDRDDHRSESRYQNRDRGYGQSSRGFSGREYPQTMRGESRYGSGYEESSGSRYGATSGYGAASSRNQQSGEQSDRERGGSHPHDDHYSEWRQQQLSAFDRDYEEYRRENRDKFHNEFTSWRSQREQQRSSMRQVREHQEVVGSDGEPVGTVDKVAGDKIILTKNGPNAGNHHHSIPCAWIQSVDEKVTINKTAAQAREKWTDEDNRRALFETDDQRTADGPHILDRSFSGTYDKR